MTEKKESIIPQELNEMVVRNIYRTAYFDVLSNTKKINPKQTKEMVEPLIGKIIREVNLEEF